MNIDISMIKSMATMMGIKIPEVEPPTNRISEFVDETIDKMLPEAADPEIVRMVKGVYIRMCNRDPNRVLQTLIGIHGSIGELVRELQMEQYIDDHPPIAPYDVEEPQSEATTQDISEDEPKDKPSEG